MFSISAKCTMGRSNGPICNFRTLDLGSLCSSASVPFYVPLVHRTAEHPLMEKIERQYVLVSLPLVKFFTIQCTYCLKCQGLRTDQIDQN